MFDGKDEFHAIPENDLVEHEFEDCVCIPTQELNDHGVCLNIHNSLDGRELEE